MMDKVTLPKRFYKQAASQQAEAGFTVELDGRPIKTPAKVSLALPTQTLADAIAEEWNSQGETLDLQGMTLTRLANVAIDRAPDTRADMAEELSRYASTDVTCYLADAPAELQQRQDAAWKPWRDWAGQSLGVVLVPVVGIVPSPQPEASLEQVRVHGRGLNDFRLTGLAWGCGLLGSAVLALAVEQGQLSGGDALRMSCIDEDWQIEQWGEDDEAQEIRAKRMHDAETLQLWFESLA